MPLKAETVKEFIKETDDFFSSEPSVIYNETDHGWFDIESQFDFLNTHKDDAIKNLITDGLKDAFNKWSIKKLVFIKKCDKLRFESISNISMNSDDSVDDWERQTSEPLEREDSMTFASQNLKTIVVAFSTRTNCKFSIEEPFFAISKEDLENNIDRGHEIKVMKIIPDDIKI